MNVSKIADDMSDAAGIIGLGSPGDDRLLPLEHAEQLRPQRLSSPLF